ncbi:uncharacterized protein LOC128931810 [Callithrix jacchus]
MKLHVPYNMLFSWLENKSLFFKAWLSVVSSSTCTVCPQLNGRQRDAKSKLTSRTTSCPLLTVMGFAFNPHLSGTIVSPILQMGKARHREEHLKVTNSLIPGEAGFNIFSLHPPKMSNPELRAFLSDMLVRYPDSIPV